MKKLITLLVGSYLSLYAENSISHDGIVMSQPTQIKMSDIIFEKQMSAEFEKIKDFVNNNNIDKSVLGSGFNNLSSYIEDEKKLSDGIGFIISTPQVNKSNILKNYHDVQEEAHLILH